MNFALDPDNLSRLNRKQRRALEKQEKKRTTPKVLNKAMVWNAVQTMMLKHSVEDQNDFASHRVLIPMYAAIAHFKAGTASLNDFHTLREMTGFGFCLAKRLHEYAVNEESRALLAPVQPVLEESAELLVTVGSRYAEEQRLRCGEKELAKLSLMCDTVAELTKVATQGHTLSAMIEAAELVRDGVDFYLKQGGTSPGGGKWETQTQ